MHVLWPLTGANVSINVCHLTFAAGSLRVDCLGQGQEACSDVKQACIPMEFGRYAYGPLRTAFNRGYNVSAAFIWRRSRCCCRFFFSFFFSSSRTPFPRSRPHTYDAPYPQYLGVRPTLSGHRSRERQISRHVSLPNTV